MYVWTRNGLGHSQPTRFTLQTFNPPAAQPTRIGYLGNFNEHLGKARSDCDDRKVVDEFDPGIAYLKDFQKNHIKDIATRFLHLINRDVQQLKGKNAQVHLTLHFEGHMDKRTDQVPYGRPLDMERIAAVKNELVDQISRLRSKIALSPFSLNIDSSSYSKKGSTQPTRATRPRVSKEALNRRVEICASWVILSE